MALSKNTNIAIVLAVVVVAAFIMLGFFGFSGGLQNAPEGTSNTQALLDELANTGTVSELRTISLSEGDGEAAKSGDTIVVHYIGVLPDGTVFDSSRESGTPFSFTLGGGQVIQGWDQGLVGTQVGDRMLLAIPPALGYGDRANGPIPPNSTLIFDIEVLDITTN